MPRTQAAIKSARQASVRRLRRRPSLTAMRTIIRKMHDIAKSGKHEEVILLLPRAMKAVDLAAKKNLIHWRNAARKKSHISRLCRPVSGGRE